MNVILVISDTFRRDNLSCYGPTKVKTPNLDKMASESYVFDNAYMGSFPTLPNRMDIMSGRFSFIEHQWSPLPAGMITLQQILSASGIVTQAVVDNPHLVESGFNYERGFDGWEWIRGQESDHWQAMPIDIQLPANPDKLNRADWLLPNYLRNTSWWKSEEDRFAPRTIKEACRRLEQMENGENFFMYIDLFDPHEPWDAPQEYLDMYETNYTGENVMYPYSGYWKEYLTEEELNHIRALYMAEASMVDHWVGVLRDKMEKLGLEEDTALIFTSDHGYLFGEHDRIGKGFSSKDDHYESFRMFSELRRLPLLIHLPGQKSNKHISAMVQPPDLMPTILEMCGLVTTESVGGKANVQALQCGVFYSEKWQFDPNFIHGKSLIPIIRGETEKLRDITVSSQTIIHHTEVLAKCAIVTEDGWCLHYSGAYEEELKEPAKLDVTLIEAKPRYEQIEPALFYLPDDPKEENNLIKGNEKLAEEIHRRYVEWLEEVGTPEEHLAGRRRLVLKK
ncbi:sulfatase [Lucifera butyrica]|uniref:Sulfatase n=1 Tax=Lucifera butyrica TaxID=1351585 RepID=A0A498R3R6_9FIRM|nr:sulfatase [Lucifera butyrica]VBB04922.1 sulfatase [Lucifera butyrica]